MQNFIKFNNYYKNNLIYVCILGLTRAFYGKKYKI